MEKQTVGDRLRKSREDAEITLEAAGKAIGKTRQTIYKYEHNIVTNVPSNFIEILANLYNTTPSYIMGWDKTLLQVDKSNELVSMRVHAIQHWSSDKLLKSDEKIVFKEHFAELLMRYKQLIERSVYALRAWPNLSQEFAVINSGASPSKLKELYLQHELKESLDNLSSYVSILPIVLSNPDKELKRYFGITINDDKDNKNVEDNKKIVQDPQDIFSDPNIPMAASGLTSTTELNEHDKAVILKHYNKNKNKIKKD